MSVRPLSRFGAAMLTTGGLGHLRPAPGTWGSLPPIAIAGALMLLGWRPEGAGLISSIGYHSVLALVIIVFCWACVRFGDFAEVHFNKKDPGSVCADETAGQCLPLLALPAAATAGPVPLVLTLTLAFLTFRLLDILKPWPAGRLQRYPGGWGILLDDLAAGVQAIIIVQLVTRLAF